MNSPHLPAVLRHRDLRLLVAGQLTSNVGDAMWAVALPWYVLATHGGAVLLGTVLAAYGIPRTALLAVSGHASDRWRPWTVMLVADVVRVGAVAALGVIALSGPARAAVIIPLAVVVGAGEGLFLPGSMSIVPSLVPDADLPQANAVASAATQVSILVGPVLGGLLVAAAGPGAGFLVDAGTFVVSAASLAAIRAIWAVRATGAALGEPAGPEEPTVEVNLRQFLRAERVFPLLLGIIVAANLGSGGMSDVALPALAHGPFHTGSTGYGLLLACFALGALVGSVAAGNVGAPGRPLVVALGGFLVEAVAMAVTPYLGGSIGAGAALAVFGLLNGFANLVAITAIQRSSQPQLLGRLMGLVLLCAFGVFPVSVLLAGFVVRHLGAAAFFPFAGGILAAAVLVGLAQPAFWRFGATATPLGGPSVERGLPGPPALS